VIPFLVSLPDGDENVKPVLSGIFCPSFPNLPVQHYRQMIDTRSPWLSLCFFTQSALGVAQVVLFILSEAGMHSVSFSRCTSHLYAQLAKKSLFTGRCLKKVH